MIGKPAITPVSAIPSIPFSTPGIYSLGIFPPLILSSKILPEPGSPPSTIIFTSANWPAPPLCFL